MMTKKDAYEALTQPQQVALDAFRERNGRNWKSALREGWERARYRNTSPDDAAALQQVRNSLGPEWLAQYRPSDVRAEDGRLVVSITDTCTQAFADVGRQAEMKRILLEAANRVREAGLADGFLLEDANGTRVGAVRLVGLDSPEPFFSESVSNGEVRVLLELGAIHFQGDARAAKIAGCLETAAEQICNHNHPSDIVLQSALGEVLGSACVSALPEGLLEAELDVGCPRLEP